MTRRNIPALIGTILGTVLALLLLTMVAQAEEVREEFHQSYALGANGRVELSNVNGFVHITTWDTNEVKVDAVKHAADADRLKDCKIEVESHPDSIRITSRYPDRDGSWFGHHSNPATVDYTIKVPRTARLDGIKAVNGEVVIEGGAMGVKASSVNGRVAARGVGGDVDLSTVNSVVEATVLSMGKNISLHSVNGRVTVTLPSDANADITVSTVNGGINNDFGLSVDRGRYVGRSLKGRLGAGGTQVSLKTVNGSISIQHAADGKPMSKATDLSEHGQAPL